MRFAHSPIPKVVHTPAVPCGQRGAGRKDAVFGSHKARDNRDMQNLLRLIEIGMKKCRQFPDNPTPAVQMLLRNALRLALLHLGVKATEHLVDGVMREKAIADT